LLFRAQYPSKKSKIARSEYSAAGSQPRSPEGFGVNIKPARMAIIRPLAREIKLARPHRWFRFSPLRIFFRLRRINSSWYTITADTFRAQMAPVPIPRNRRISKNPAVRRRRSVDARTEVPR